MVIACEQAFGRAENWGEGKLLPSLPFPCYFFPQKEPRACSQATMVSKGQFVGLDCEWVVILYLTLFSFLKQWEIYDAYVEDLQKQVRLDGCVFFVLIDCFLAFRYDTL